MFVSSVRTRCSPSSSLNLTGVTVLMQVNPSIMSEAGDGTVELLAPVLFELKRQNNVKRDASW